MSEDQAERRSRARNAAVAGAVLGAAGGAAIGSVFGGPGALVGALLGAVLQGTGEGLTDWYRQPGETKPIWWRIVGSASLVAALSWCVELLVGTVHPALYGAAVGLVLGALGARLAKLAIGIAVGALVGLALGLVTDDPSLVIVGAAVAVAYRILSHALYRGRELTEIRGEAIDPDTLPFLVPYAASGPTVGPDYLRDLSADNDWQFERSPAGAGIVGSLAEIDGPEFDSSQVTPLIREFYEHTTRFALDIVPEWRWWMKLPYWIFRRVVSLRIDQVNVPYNQREAQRGMISYVDVASPADREKIRAWVRVFEDTGATIYVGIYTTTRYDGSGYVAVGFPLPSSNITVALSPRNLDDGGLLLSSRLDERFCGHYLSAIEPDKGATTLRLGLFHEEIEVYTRDGRLLTDHRFFLGGVRFLKLRYSIHRKRS